MKCHYEILELSRDAEDGEIKSAYRKLALKWHPDKNLDHPELAKEQFQIVQQAYEVLSDKQERAWYDAHREQILRGASSEFQDKSLDVFQYFTTCFKGFGDDDESFYSVYRKVFEQIGKEDIEFMDEKEEFCEIPCFGYSGSDSESVKAFYDYWMSYSTKKSYSWLDPYDIREGKGDRRLLKIIDKENKKARLKARKERNEEVRNLVAFVRKRDKRVQAFKKEMEAKTLENRKKHEELSKQKRLERKQMHATEKQADWLKFDNVKSELEEIEKNLAEEFGEELSQSEEEEEVDFGNLYCVACNKVFKNPKAFENHEVSKKHKENVEKLRQSMLEEEDLESNDDLDEYNDLDGENLEEFIEENGAISGEDSIAEDENLAEINERCKTDEVEEENSDEDNKSVKKTKKKSKRAKNVLNTSQNGHIAEGLDITKISDDEFDFSANKNQKKKSRKGNNSNKLKSNETNISTKQVEEESKENDINEETISAKKQRKKEKRTSKKDIEQTDLSEVDVSHCCVTCKNNFPSKNKLFEHLKKTGHGVYLPSKTKQTTKKNSVKN